MHQAAWSTRAVPRLGALVPCEAAAMGRVQAPIRECDDSGINHLAWRHGEALPVHARPDAGAARGARGGSRADGGPPPAPPQVLRAGAEPMGHPRGLDFREVFERTLERLQQVFRTESPVLLFS